MVGDTYTYYRDPSKDIQSEVPDTTKPKFDVVTIESDRSATWTWVDKPTSVFYISANDVGLGNIDGTISGNCTSGTSFPSSPVNYLVHYKTDENKIYRYYNGSWIHSRSLPIAIVNGSSGITSIDQVFNGFGYIGSTVFALPGVKGLIPNGRNADGSLKNTEVSITQVTTWFNNNYTFTNFQLGILNNSLTVGQYTYNQETNTTSENRCIVGNISGTSGRVDSISIKTAFHAVDWNDLEDKLNHFNNPFSLLDYKWSEYALSNASWLLSNGQFNSGATYPAVYELLLKIKNGTETKDGVSVKLSTEAYTDTDFVVNTADTTFRLPIKVKLASGNAVVGNGMTLGLTDGTNNIGLMSPASGSASGLSVTIDAYGKSVGTSQSASSLDVRKTKGITTDPTKSGIETSSSGLKLYFYVGETIQDANVIAASQVLTKVANGIDRTSATDRETVVGWGMPDYSAGIDIKSQTNAGYTAPSKGFIVFYSKQGTQAHTLKINDNVISTGASSGNTYDCTYCLPVEKGDVFKYSVAVSYVDSAYFFPLKGVN